MTAIIRLCAALTLTVAAALPARAAVEIQEVTSPGGITAWLVEEHSIPFVALELRFRGGAALDVPGKTGAVNLMMGLLEEGAGDMDARDFLKAREALAADFDFDTRTDSVSVSARVLTENRDASLALLRTAMIEPRFAETAVERVRAQVLSVIAANAQDPAQIAHRTFDRLAFGAHPYGRAVEGTAETVRALTREDIATAHRAALARDRVYVAAVGDITAEELGPLLDRLLGDLPSAGAPLPEKAGILLEGGETVVPFATPQSVAVFGHEGIPDDDPDFIPAFILNQILGGGGFGSRLMEEVREKRGLTYGIYTYLAPMDRAALVMGQVASQNDRIAEAVDLVRAEWQRVAAEGVSAEGLAAAQTYLTGAYPLRFDGNGTIARILAGMQISGKPIDYVKTRNDKVNAVTVEDIRRVAARLLDPERLHFVVVGQPEGLGAGN